MDYSRAVELAPYAPVPYLNRAIALEELGLQAAAEGRSGDAQERWVGAVRSGEVVWRPGITQALRLNECLRGTWQQGPYRQE